MKPNELPRLSLESFSKVLHLVRLQPYAQILENTKKLVRDNAVAYFTQYRLNVLNFSLVADKVDYLYLATRTIPK